jgi:hypothetical protein
LLKVGEGVGSTVGGYDVAIGEPLVGVQTAVVEDDGLEEVDYLFMLGVLRTIARDVKGGEAGSMLGEFVLWLCQPWSGFLIEGHQEES